MSAAPRPFSPRAIPTLADDAHKGSAGRVLCLAGSPGMPGAAVLAGRAAMRAGAGLVSIVTRTETQDAIVVGACPEAVLLRVPDAADLGALFEPLGFHARLVGPGLGRDGCARAAFDACLADVTAPLALDADALHFAAGRPELLSERGGEGALILTPHPGEARALLGRQVPPGDDGRLAFALELATRARAIVCLKGARTVVSDGVQAYVNSTGNPGMATAGSGDVLAGILTAYLACAHHHPRDWDAFDAAATAVRVHGRAGDLAAAELGRRAVIASDLIDFLPRAQREDLHA